MLLYYTYNQSVTFIAKKKTDSIKSLKPSKCDLLDFVNAPATLATRASIPQCTPTNGKGKKGAQYETCGILITSPNYPVIK